MRGSGRSRLMGLVLVVAIIFQSNSAALAATPSGSTNRVQPAVYDDGSHNGGHNALPPLDDQSRFFAAADQARGLMRAWGDDPAVATGTAFQEDLLGLRAPLEQLADGEQTAAALAALRHTHQELARHDLQLRRLFDTAGNAATDATQPWQQPGAAEQYRALWNLLSAKLAAVEQAGTTWDRAAARSNAVRQTHALAQAAVNALAFLQNHTRQQEPEAEAQLGGVASPRQIQDASGLPSIALASATTATAAPTQADLAPTIDVQIPQEIIDLAARLGNSPVKIYEYVRNKVAYYPYYGSLKGSTATLWTQAGNDYDQASLLLALLRAAKVPSHYVSGQITIPIDQAEQWLGVTDANAVYRYLFGIPREKVMAGDALVAVKIAHVWVEAYASLEESGPYNSTGEDLAWVPLDPSFKQMRYQQGLALPSSVSFNRAEFLQSVTSSLPQEAYQDAAREYLRTTMPGKSVSEIPYVGTIVPAELGRLPASLPYAVDQIAERYADIPDTLRHKVTVAVDDLNVNQTLIPTTTLTLPQMSLNRVTLFYKAEGTAMRPVLAVEGVPAATGAPTLLGARNQIAVGYLYPGVGLVDYVVDVRTAGEHHALNFFAQQTGARLLGSRAEKLLAAAALAGTAQANKDDQLGELLYLAGMRYFQRVVEGEQMALGLYHHYMNRLVYYGLLTAQSNNLFLFDRPFAVSPSGATLDVGMVYRTASYGIDGDSSRLIEAAQVMGITSSAAEHQIWEEMLLEVSISTIKGLQYANEKGQPQYRIDASNLSQILPLLAMPQWAKDYLAADVNKGWTVITHRDLLLYNRWQGIVWISENPQTGNAGYWISGRAAGGASACPGCPAQPKKGPKGVPPDCTGSLGQPVTLSNGNMYHQFADIVIPTRGPALQFVRTYNAQSTDTGPLGYGWTHNYNLRLTENAATGNVTFRNDSGGEYLFTKTGNAYTPAMGIFLTLTKEAAGFSLRDVYGTRWEFNAAGQLTKVTDRNGNAQTLTYSANGRLASVSDPLGRKLSFSYNVFGKLTSVSDFAGRTWSYTYNATDDLVSSTAPADANTPAYITRYDYYTQSPLQHNLKTITDPRGNALSFTYYSNDKAFQTIEPENKVTTFYYLPFRNETQVVSERGFVWSYHYDDNGFVTRIDRPDGNAILRGWNSAGSLVSYIDGRGATTTMTYDARGNLLSSADALGQTYRYAYDPTFSQLTAYTDARGNSATLTVDAANGNITAATDALGKTSSFRYDAYGNLTGSTDANGHAAALGYDANSYLARVENGRGNAWALERDALGRLTSLTDALGNRTAYTYDAIGRALSASDAEGNAWSYEYDGNSNLTRQTDAEGKATAYTYDGNDNLTSVTDALGQITRLGYDAVGCVGCNVGTGNLTSLTDANGYTRRYEYDGLDRLTRETDALSTSKSYHYDAQDNLVGFADERGSETTYRYDPIGQLLGVQFPAGTTEAYSYDANGNLLTAANATTTLSYAYDARNQVTQASDGALGKAIGYSYDNVGNRATLAAPDGRSQSYSYDASDNLASLTGLDGVVTTFAFDAAERLTQLAPAAGQPGVHTTLAYDRASRLTGLRNASADGAKSFIDFSFSYDKVGNLATQTAAGLPAFGSAIGQTSYTYDAIYRLTGATPPAGTAQTYGYDAAGNRVQQAAVRNYHDESDRLLDGNGATYAYDERGNLRTKSVGGQTTTYTWDDENQLTRIDYPDGKQSSYSYDAFGRRSSRTLRDGTAVRYLYDGANVLQEYDAAGSVAATYVHTQAIDHPLSMTRGGQTSYYLYDRLGSVIGLSDGAGALRASYAYDAWGNSTGGDEGGIANPYRYTGREYDAESGLYYNRARYYDPQAGRFISRDPIGLAGGVNEYAYVGNNPMNWIDAFGLCSQPKASSGKTPSNKVAPTKPSSPKAPKSPLPIPKKPDWLNKVEKISKWYKDFANSLSKKSQAQQNDIEARVNQRTQELMQQLGIDEAYARAQASLEIRGPYGVSPEGKKGLGNAAAAAGEATLNQIPGVNIP